MKMKYFIITFVILKLVCQLECELVSEREDSLGERNDRTPTITYISQEQVKDIDDTLKLECSTQYSQQYPVVWIKYDRLRSPEYVTIISTNTALLIPDSRFAIRYDPSNSTYKLQIKHIQESDGGFYRCQIIISPNNRISAEVELQVRTVVPESRLSPTIEYISPKQIIDIGGKVEIFCVVKDVQEYPVSWIKYERGSDKFIPITNGRELIVHDSRYDSDYNNGNFGYALKIKNIQESDAGNYVCEVNVSATKKISAEVELQLRGTITAEDSTRL